MGEPGVEWRKLKIALSIWSFTPNTGGLQAHAQLLGQYLQRRGHDVRIVTKAATHNLIYNDYLFFNEPDQQLQVGSLPVCPIRISRLWGPVLWTIQKTVVRPAFDRLATSLYQIVSAKSARQAFAGFDIIHHIGQSIALVGFAAARAAKLNKTPFLIQPTVHPLNVGDSDLDLRLYRLADRLLVHTQYEKDYLISKGINCPVDVVGNGVEDRTDGQGERFRARYGINGRMILYIGRKEEDKGYPLVVNAFKQLSPRYPDLTLVCMGPNPYNIPNENFPSIIDLDFVTEEVKHDALAACTLLCVPSTGESFGLVYMEAGRYGKPVIGRNLPVLRELLEEGEAGLLLGTPCDERNSAELKTEELANGIQRLLDDPSLCRHLGERSYAVSNSFVMQMIIRNFEQAYDVSLRSVPHRESRENILAAL